MEQDVDNGFKAVCCACLSGDRNLVSLNSLAEVVDVFKLLMYDFAGERIIDSEAELKQYVCWECFAIMKKISRFKRQIHNAQQHLRVFSLQSSWEMVDHAYFSQSLSSLESVIKPDYDRMYIDYTHEVPERTEIWTQPYLTISDGKTQQYDVGIDDHVLGMPEIVVENPVTGVMSHIVVREPLLEDTFTADPVKGELPELILDSTTSVGSVIIRQTSKVDDQLNEENDKLKSGYVTEYMCESEMLAAREEAKQKVQYASSVYKCELCVVGFYNQQQVEDHFVAAHRAKLGYNPCKVCYVYVESSQLQSHQDSHYLRLVCRLCGHADTSVRLMKHHVQTHMAKPPPSALIKIGDTKVVKKKHKETEKTPPKPGDLRKLLSKTTIVGYKCLECDMFFKNSRARKNHVARCHREGLQCDHCKKRFVNRTTLATHLRLHEGPLPREKCPVCNKMVRVIQLKYHIQRHQNTERYECKDCDKVFSHLTTYQAHLKYSRPHASDNVFKFPCPMCNKGYPTKEAMQDHFNYQHLGKTTHKCPVCSKPIASKANVEKHMMRVHGEKKEKPRSHVCQQCGKGFTDKKALSQHAVIHSVDRPLSCDICHQTFKQKASLYTHKKRVHKVFPSKRVVEFMDLKKES